MAEEQQAEVLPEANVPAAPACLMVIFGATGDLTKRLLLPSIYNLVSAKVLPESFRLLGVAVDDWDREKFRQHIADTLKQFWGPDADPAIVSRLTGEADYLKVDFGQPGDFDSLREHIRQTMADVKSNNTLFYMAVAPSFISPIAAELSRVGLLSEEDGCWRRLVIEKPFGHDLPSAVALNAELQKSLREDQIYRIDHFAGKDAVQDLAVFRFVNAIIEPLWNRVYIDHVEITAAETVGVEKRATYYETAGALRDMVPNHMAELLSLVAMEPPVSLSADHMRDKQVELLSSIRRVSPDQVHDIAVRGQYDAGTVGGKPVVAYRQEPGVQPQSNTETYVAMRVDIDNWRWSGVPFFLRTGKHLNVARTEIVVTFRQPPARLFPHAETGAVAPNHFLFQLQPSPGIQLRFGTRVPGLGDEVKQGSMRFQFDEGPFADHAKGYERLLHDVMTGNQILFQRAAFVEEGWRLVQPLIEAWQAPPEGPFPNYAAGSSGPAAADQLIADACTGWHSLEEA